MMKMTDASLANKSGTYLEETLEQLLKAQDIPYKRQSHGKSQIDFIINDSIYADCTNQNSTGSVEEKIPHKVWKYWKMYGYKDVYIIKGKWNVSPKVLEHLEDASIAWGYTTHIVSIDEFMSVVMNEPKKASPLEQFMRKEIPSIPTNTHDSP